MALSMNKKLPYREDNQPTGWLNVSKLIMSSLLIALAALAIFLPTLFLQGSLSALVPAAPGTPGTISEGNAFDMINNAAEMLAVILSIVITVVAIIVELAANRYSHRITSLFVREPVNIIVLVYLVVATVYCLWVALTLEAERVNPVIGNAGLYASMLFVTLSLVILLPYFAFVMSFLLPENVIRKIKLNALHAITNTTSANTHESQGKLLASVDDLQDISRRASEVSDRAVETACIEALHSLVVSYQHLRPELVVHIDKWFKISRTIRNDPDFVSLLETSLANIEKNRLWVETKVMRQYLDLMIDGKVVSRDISYQVAINTRTIAMESYHLGKNMELIKLCIQCFNSYLRSTINKKDARTCYYVMNQYRMLAEDLIREKETFLARIITTHLKYYGLLAYEMDMPFILEVAAEDLMTLIMSLPADSGSLVTDLVDIFLELDQEVKSQHQEQSLVGVRRAQIKLATFFLEQKEQELVDRICKDMASEDPRRLNAIMRKLHEENRQEYWEFTDRGANFSYLEPRFRKHLVALQKKLVPTK